MEQSLVFAEVSMISYLPQGEAELAASTMGFTSTVFIERDGAQAYVFDSPHDRVVACRGTEPNEWNDIKADANALTDLAETVGRVHRGFKRVVDDLWPRLKEVLADSQTPVWFTGHSLGGAMATICGGRCVRDHIPKSPEAVYTYGSPRVGTQRYVQHADLTHIRWVHNNDIVTRVPPTWLRYRHTGERMYLDRNGDVAKMTPRQRAKDRWKGFTSGLGMRRIDMFSDHAIADYVEHIARANGFDPGKTHKPRRSQSGGDA